MRRRDFTILLGGAAVWPSSALAQPAKLPTIGFLGPGTSSAFTPWTAAFVQRLRELGWIEGRTIAIEYRWADGRTERFREIAAEFVRLKVDVIVTAGSAVPAVMQTTSTIPIVFAIAVDPIGSGMIASLARPGGNVTGLSLLSSELVSKRIELLRDVLPNLSRLAVIANVGSRGAVLELAEVRTVARKFGIDIEALEIRRAEDIAPAFGALKKGAQALYVCFPMHWSMPTMFASTLSRWARDCLLFTHSVTLSELEVLCLTDQITPTFSGGPATLSTKFSKERSPLTFPWSSQPSLNSSST